MAPWLVRSVDSGSNSPGSAPAEILRCVLDKTLYNHGASLHPGVQLGTGEPNAEGNPVMD